jgi:hypothetical protein
MAMVLYQKTAKGMEEAKERKYKLEPRTRTALMLVIGAKPAQILVDQWRAIGAPQNVEQVLVTGGFIEATGLTAANMGEHREAVESTHGPVTPSNTAQRFLDAELFMEQTVMSVSGLKSYFFQLKLQKCGNLEDLRAMLPYYESVITKGGGETQAKVLVEEVKRMLG